MSVDSQFAVDLLRKILSDVQRIDALTYQQVLMAAQSSGHQSLLSIGTKTSGSPVDTPHGEAWPEDVLLEWAVLHQRGDSFRLFFEKLSAFIQSLKSIRRWANDEAWIDDADELRERRITLGELSADLLRFGNSLIDAIHQRTGDTPPFLRTSTGSKHKTKKSRRRTSREVEKDVEAAILLSIKNGDGVPSLDELERRGVASKGSITAKRIHAVYIKKFPRLAIPSAVPLDDNRDADRNAELQRLIREQEADEHREGYIDQRP